LKEEIEGPWSSSLDVSYIGTHSYNILAYGASATPTTVTNSQYNADGTLNQARLTPQTSGFGAATAAQSLRTVQVQVRFLF